MFNIYSNRLLYFVCTDGEICNCYYITVKWVSFMVSLQSAILSILHRHGRLCGHHSALMNCQCIITPIFFYIIKFYFLYFQLHSASQKDPD